MTPPRITLPRVRPWYQRGVRQRRVLTEGWLLAALLVALHGCPKG